MKNKEYLDAKFAEFELQHFAEVNFDAETLTGKDRPALEKMFGGNSEVDRI